MEIFVLVGEWAYESHRVLGVYSTRREAISARETYMQDNDTSFDYYYVERRVLDSPVIYETDGDYI